MTTVLLLIASNIFMLVSFAMILGAVYFAFYGDFQARIFKP